jgi:hypothetical protein
MRCKTVAVRVVRRGLSGLGAAGGTALPALAHGGFHPHPHGIELGWIVAALAGLLGGVVLSRLRGRK